MQHIYTCPIMVQLHLMKDLIIVTHSGWWECAMVGDLTNLSFQVYSFVLYASVPQILYSKYKNLGLGLGFGVALPLAIIIITLVLCLTRLQKKLKKVRIPQQPQQYGAIQQSSPTNSQSLDTHHSEQ